jgi:hypothetical protein
MLIYVNILCIDHLIFKISVGFVGFVGLPETDIGFVGFVGKKVFVFCRIYRIYRFCRKKILKFFKWAKWGNDFSKYCLIVAFGPSKHGLYFFCKNRQSDKIRRFPTKWGSDSGCCICFERSSI